MRSQNGWPVLSVGETWQWVIPTTGRSLRLHRGAAGFVLAHLALWYHESIEPLDGGVWDDWGWAFRMVRGSTDSISNHASGTAVDLNAVSHPLGVRNTHTKNQQATIRARLAGRYGKAIRWGGDYLNRADEMHFEVNSGTAGILAVAESLRDSPRGRRVALANGGTSH